MCDVSNFETKPGYSKNSHHSTENNLVFRNHKKYIRNYPKIKTTHEKETVCQQCKTKFNDFHTLVNHTCKPFKCMLCSEGFLHDYQLKQHNCDIKITEEKKADEFICDSCELTFETSEILSKHTISCSKNLRGQCVGCNKKLPTNFHEVCDDCKLKNHKSQQQNLQNYINKTVQATVLSVETVEALKDGCSEQPLENPTMNSQKRINGKLVKKKTKKTDLGQSLDSQVQNKESNVSKKSYINGSSFASPTDSLPDRKIHFSGKFKTSKKQQSATSSVKLRNDDWEKQPKKPQRNDDLEKQSKKPHFNDDSEKQPKKTHDDSEKQPKKPQRNDDLEKQPKKSLHNDNSEDQPKKPLHDDGSEKQPKKLRQPQVVLSKIKVFNLSKGISEEANSESLHEETGLHDLLVSDDNLNPSSSGSLNKSTRKKTKNLNNKQFKAMKDVPFIEVTVSGNCKKSRIVNIQNKKESILENTPADPDAKEILSKSTFTQKIAQLNDVTDDHSSTAATKSVKRNATDDAPKISFKKKKIEHENSKNRIHDVNFNKKEKTSKKHFVHKSTDSLHKHYLESKKIEKSSAKNDSIKADIIKSNLASETLQVNCQKNTLEKKRKCVTFCLKNNKKKIYSPDKAISVSVKNRHKDRDKQEFHRPKDGLCKASNQRTPSNGISFNGCRLISENPKKKHHPFDKNKKSVIVRNIPLELEVTKSTLSAIPDVINKPSYPNSKEISPNSKHVENNFIELETLYKALPPRTGFLLKVFNSNIPSFRCSKCSKLFPKMKSGAVHYGTCNSRFKKKMLINLNEVAIFCTICYFHCNVMSEMVFHGKICSLADNDSSITLSDYLLRYENTSKNYICPKCGYSSISQPLFSQHPCEKRLEYMQMCTVGVERLTPKYLQSLTCLAKFECSSCGSIFYDDVSFKKHAEIHLREGVTVGKVFIDNGKSFVVKRIKKIIRENQNCENTDELMEKVLIPISELLDSVSDTDNLLPEFKLDLTLTPAIRKLVEEVRFKSLVQKDKTVSAPTVDFLNLKNLVGEEDDDKKTDPSHITASAVTSSILDKFKCTCEKEVRKPDNPNSEEKPCVKCLHKFMEDYYMSESQPVPLSSETVQTQNSSNITDVASVSNGLVINDVSSLDPSNILNTSSSCAYVGGGIANPFETPANTSTPSDINLPPNGLFVSQQSNSCFPSTSGLDSSSAIVATDVTNLDDCRRSLEIFSTLYQTDLTEFNSSGMYLNGKEANELNSDTSVAANNVIQVSVSELSEMLRINSATDISNSLPLDLQSKDNGNIDYLYGDQNYQQAQSVALDLPFPLKDVSVPFMDSSSEGKTPTFPTSLSPNLEQAMAGFSPPLTPSDDSVKLHTCVKDNSNDCSCERRLLSGSFDPLPESSASEKLTFEKTMEKLLSSGEKNDVEFNVGDAKIIVHYTFSENVTYSAFLLREEQRVKYICGSCVLEYPVSDLIQHLVTEHKENEINLMVS